MPSHNPKSKTNPIPQSKNQSTNIELITDINTIADKLADYKSYLIDQYDNYMLCNHRPFQGKEADDIRQIIYSFAYPKQRLQSHRSITHRSILQDDYHKSRLNLYNYCLDCRQFKHRTKMINRFCMEYCDGLNDNWSRYNHDEESICKSCIDRRINYGITHHDDRYKPRCPRCNQRHKFHHIDYRDLTKSYPSRCFIIDNILKKTTTTTKKLNIVKLDDCRSIEWIRGKNHKGVIIDGVSYKINTNSYAFKFSLLYRVLKVNRGLYGNAEWDYHTNDIPTDNTPIIQYLSMLDTRGYLGDMLINLKHNYTINNFTSPANQNFIYSHDEANTYPLENLYRR